MKNILDYIEQVKDMYNDQEPRYMKLAKANDIPEAFNPDLEQSEFLKKGETLEDWKPNPFLKPHADGGRAGYNDGQLVTPSVDGSRPGYKGKNQHTGNNPLNIKQSTYDLIPQIKEDAKTMSQIEIEKKYKIHKKTLKKIKNAENIEFRKSYLPEGAQKKSIPYADRYTAQEKSEMYKKRKATETEEDRIKARERKKKYDDKVFKEYKMEPSSKTFYDDLWKDIARSANEGDRIKLLEGPKYASGASYDDFKSRVFLDTKTNETFTYDTLKNYLDSGKLEGVTYKSVIEPYELKNKIANSGLREDIQKAYFGDKYQPPKRFRAQNTFHVHHIGGVAADPFSVQLTFADENLGLVHNKTFNKNWAKLIEKNAPLSERKAYLKFVKSKTGENIAQTLEFPEVGKTRTYGEIGTDMQKLLSDPKFKKVEDINKFLKQAGFNIDKCLSSGGRVKLQGGKGVNTCITGVLEEEQAKAMKGNKLSKAKFGKFGKLARAGAWILGPIDIPLELAFALPHMLSGDKEAAKRATTFGLFGWGKSKMDEIKAGSAEGYKYAKHIKDTNDWMDAWFSQQDAEQNLSYLKDLPEHAQKEKKLIYSDQKLKAEEKMNSIMEGYKGYYDEEGKFDVWGEAKGKSAFQDYLIKDVKEKTDKGLDMKKYGGHGMNIALGLPWNFGMKEGIAPFKGGKPITNLKQHIAQKGQPYWKQLEHAAYEAGVPKLFDHYFATADVREPEDAYSDLPIKYASQLGKLEKEEMLRGLKGKGLYGTVSFKKMLEAQGIDPQEVRYVGKRGWDFDILGKRRIGRADGGRAGYMGGGIAAIRKPHAIPPERQGLRSIMINVNDD